MTENEIGKVVVDAALKVHRELGHGLLETVYEVVLAREWERRGLPVERQVPVPMVYEGLRFEEGHHRGRQRGSLSQSRRSTRCTRRRFSRL